MTLEDMIQDFRTELPLGADKAVTYLNRAQEWVANRILPVNLNILKVNDDQIAIASTTRTLDLAASVSTGVLYQIEWLGVKFSGDTEYHPVDYRDPYDGEFISLSQQSAGTAHPVLVVIENFDQVRFARPLPSGASVRADYIFKPDRMSLETHATCDLPEPFHQCLVLKAQAFGFRGIDDDRARECNADAFDYFQSAMNVALARRFPNRRMTQPWPARSRGIHRRTVP